MFSELADRLVAFANAMGEEEDSGYWGRRNGVVLSLARSVLALWNEHAEKKTPGFVASFDNPGELREYLEEWLPDTFTLGLDDAETTTERARDWMEVCRQLATWAGETELSKLQRWILSVFDAEGRLCADARDRNDLRKAIKRHFGCLLDPKRIRQEANKLAAMGLVERSLGRKQGYDLTDAGRNWLAR